MRLSEAYAPILVYNVFPSMLIAKYSAYKYHIQEAAANRYLTKSQLCQSTKMQAEIG